MAKNSILDYSTTPDNNTDMGGIGIQGTSAVNNFDNAFRTLMSQIAEWTDASTIASGTTTDLSTVKGMYVSVTGTSTITSFGTAKAGWMKYLRFAGAATITHNATSLILPGAANITTQPGDYALFVSEGSGNWRCLEYSRAAALVRPAQRGQIYGLTLSNNASDSTNDIDVASGDCASDDTVPVLLSLSSSLTKRLDAAWAVGTGNGGLDTGSVGNNTYHVFLIRRSDAGVVDALFSLSPTAPTMPSGYDSKRRIGSFYRTGGANVLFTQIGNSFYRALSATERNSTTPATNILLTLTVPTGIKLRPMLSCLLISAGAGSFGNMQIANGDASTTITDAIRTNAGADVTNGILTNFYTNTSAQVRFSQSFVGTNVTTAAVVTIGWVDDRGTF